jgi:thiol-disulfide isomerase/thioredoxin
MKYNRLSVTILFLVFFSINAFAQVSRIEPAEPRWGDRLIIRYDAAAESATLTAADDLHVSIRVSYPGYSDTVWARMNKSGAQFRCEVPVKDNSNFIAIHFLTPNGGWDEGAYVTAAVLRRDGKPARGANESRIQSQRYREFFEKERSLYPDNYSAYRAKWTTALLVEGEVGLKVVRGDLEKLSKQQPETAELLCAMVVGNLLLAREDKAMESLRRAASTYPADVFTAVAVAEAERMIPESGIPSTSLPEVAKLKLTVLKQAPQSSFARAALAALTDEQNPRPEQLPLVEAIATAWSKAEPDHPLAFLYLARGYERQYQQPERAAELLNKAILLLREGKLRLFGDVNGKQTDRMLLAAYLSKAEIASRLGKNEPALATLATAKQLSPADDFRAWLLEARILGAINQPERAESAFLEAWRRGSREADERLKARYKERRGSLQGYDEYLVGKGRGEKSPASEWKLPAPRFHVSTLDGHSYDSKSLEGHVVVLNMWFIGCGPCRKEIPKLNELAREFKKKGVLFLAPTPDLPETLQEFLKTMPFEYELVPSADRLLDQFNIANFPTHIIINRQGMVEEMMIGARERAPEEIRRVLLKLSQEK